MSVSPPRGKDNFFFFLEKNVLKIGRKLRGIRDDDEERIRNS
jgi:hypothetical protein